MQKKPGQISSNTLSLRFMKNAARARQEREVEEAKTKVSTEEEWELAPEIRERLEGQVDDQTVSYEPSYLPFLFPGLSSTSMNTIPVTHTKAEPDDWHGVNDSFDEAAGAEYRGRRKFGKHGKESVEDTSMPEATPLPPEVVLPRGFKSISSHGPAAASTARSKASRRPPQRVATPSPPPQLIPNIHLPPPPKLHGFMKPPVEAPRPQENTGARKRRPAEGVGAFELSNADHTDDMDDNKPKKKKKKRNE